MNTEQDNPNFCPAPWLSFYIDPSGNVENCCVSKNQLGNIEQDASIKEIIFTGKNKNIQQDMLDGKSVDGCRWCHNKSHTLQSRFFDIFPDRHDSLYDKAGNFELRYMDLRWSNVCNYACVYCGPELSSTWADELKQTHRIDRSSKNTMLDYVLENIHTLKELYLAGGEPLMMKENEIVLKALSEKNPDCHVCVNTNLSQTENNQIFELLVARGDKTQWLVSVDDMNERYEYLRYPGKWETFAKNLDLLKQKSNSVTFNMVFINLNALTIWDTVDYLLDQGHRDSGITLTLYNNGGVDGDWDIKHMSKNFQDRVIERMDRPKYRGMIGWQNIYEYLKNDQIQLGGNPWSTMSILDQRRGLDSRGIFPLVYEYKDTQ
jgi:MoaA/NifB/PqqE/SkfB family radical SAM enzyme